MVPWAVWFDEFRVGCIQVVMCAFWLGRVEEAQPKPGPWMRCMMQPRRYSCDEGVERRQRVLPVERCEVVAGELLKMANLFNLGGDPRKPWVVLDTYTIHPLGDLVC